MQIIFDFGAGPEEYVQTEAHRLAARPDICPHCLAYLCLEALGYYSRWISSFRVFKPLRIWVRRFRCRSCGRTVSRLPSFAQPYRLIRNETIQRAFSGLQNEIDVLRWKLLLDIYWLQFTHWLPTLAPVIGQQFKRAPPSARPMDWWLFLLGLHGDISSLTEELIKSHQVTLFGRYHCHQPNPP